VLETEGCRGKREAGILGGTDLRALRGSSRGYWICVYCLRIALDIEGMSIFSLIKYGLHSIKLLDEPFVLVAISPASGVIASLKLASTDHIDFAA